jgi:hypothetical protein
MRCKHCDAKLAIHDLWCSNCGKQTAIVNTDLSAWKSIKRTWANFSPIKGINAASAAISVLCGMVPIVVLLVILHSLGILDFKNAQLTGTLIYKVLITAAAVSVFLPMLLIPYNQVCLTEGYSLQWRKILGSIVPLYSRYLLLSLILVGFQVIVYLICFGLPSFGSDPILRLVWVVLVNYFAALVIPVPIIMERQSINAWKALKISYRYFHVVRWQLYLLVLVIGIMNSVALAVLVLPILITLPFSWLAVRDYTDLLLEYEIIRPGK